MITGTIQRQSATTKVCTDEAVEASEKAMPCKQTGMILTIDDPEEANAAFDVIRSPLPIELEEIPLENGADDELETEEALPKGVSFSSVMAKVNESKVSGNTKTAELANEIANMDLLFDKVRQKMGPEEFALFLALFSLSARTKVQGQWQIEYDGKKHAINGAVFKVRYEEKIEYAVQFDPDNRSLPERGGNVYCPDTKVFNDNFEIIVTPEYIEKSGPWPFQYTKKPQMATIDELADLLIDEIYRTVKVNNMVDWWTSKTLTAIEIALTVAAVFSGVGMLLRAGHLIIRATGAAVIVLQTSNTIDAVTRFIGVSEEGYNPLLAAARALDGKDSSKFEMGFHAINMMMTFGKSGTWKTLSAIGSASAGAGLFYVTEQYKITEQPIQAYEDPQNYDVQPAK